MFFKRSKKAEDKSATTSAGTTSSSTLNATPSPTLTPAALSSISPTSNLANSSKIPKEGQGSLVSVQKRSESLSNNVAPNKLGQQSPTQPSGNRRRSSANQNPSHQNQQSLLQPVDIAMSLAVNQHFNQFNNQSVMHSAAHLVSQPMGYHNGHTNNRLGHQMQPRPVGYGVSSQADSVNLQHASSGLHPQNNGQSGNLFVNNTPRPVSNPFYSNAYTHDNRTNNYTGHLVNQSIPHGVNHRPRGPTNNVANQQNQLSVGQSDNRLTNNSAVPSAKHPSPGPGNQLTGASTVEKAPSSKQKGARFNPAASSFNPGPTSSIQSPPPKPTVSQPTLPRADSLDIQKTKRTPTDSSYYSCTELQPNDPLRYIKAADVRRQVQQAPSEKPPFSPYPKLYQNLENLKLQAPEEQFEWPIMSQGDWNPSRAPNKVRAMFNKTDRSAFDVAYHDKKISQDSGKNFRLANYRPSVAAAKDAAQKKS